jgi:hypothetical protein
MKSASLLHDQQQSDPEKMMLVRYDHLNQIELRYERKGLMARDLTTGSLTTVWQYIYVGMQ